MLPLSSLREGGSHGPGNGAPGGIPAGVRALSPGGSWLLGCLLPGLCGFGGRSQSAVVWRVQGSGGMGLGLELTERLCQSAVVWRVQGSGGMGLGLELTERLCQSAVVWRVQGSGGMGLGLELTERLLICFATEIFLKGNDILEHQSLLCFWQFTCWHIYFLWHLKLVFAFILSF